MKKNVLILVIIITLLSVCFCIPASGATAVPSVEREHITLVQVILPSADCRLDVRLITEGETEPELLEQTAFFQNVLHDHSTADALKIEATDIDTMTVADLFGLACVAGEESWESHIANQCGNYTAVLTNLNSMDVTGVFKVTETGAVALTFDPTIVDGSNVAADCWCVRGEELWVTGNDAYAAYLVTTEVEIPAETEDASTLLTLTFVAVILFAFAFVCMLVFSKTSNKK